MPLKLIYFPTRGRAEASRLALYYQKIEYEDVRMPGPELIAEYRKDAPFGQFPLLEVDGRYLGQSGAILRYVTRNLRPADPFDAATMESIADQGSQDLSQVIYPYIFCKEPAEKARLGEELKDKHFPKLLPGIVNYLGDRKFFGGDKPNAADFAVYATIENALKWGVPGFEAYPTLMAHQKAVRALPELEGYWEKREQFELV
jgi:glutathione S-transferase